MEGDKPRLVGVDHQAVLAEPLRQDFHHTLGVTVVAKPHNEIIRKADEEGTVSQSTLHLLLEPEIQHIVQEQIRKDGRSRSSNDIANTGGFFDRLIPRESLRPAYGEGWKPS